MSNTTKKLTVFLDNVGRTIIGKVSKEDETTLTLENPALVHIQPNPQNNQLQLQILPLFFKEFQEDRSKSSHWVFRKNNITLGESIDFAAQFVAQYDQLFIPQLPPGEPKTVKLFDEEE